MKIGLVNSAVCSGRAFAPADPASDIRPTTPLMLARLAAIARQQKHEVAFVDCAVQTGGPRETLSQVSHFRPDLLVLCAEPCTSPFARQLSTALDSRFKALNILGVGAFFSLFGIEAMKACPAVDALIVGEPELTFMQLLHQLAVHREILGVNGLVWRENGRVRSGPPQVWIAELDGLPMPARDLLDADAYRCPHTGRRITAIAPARGCAHGCSFCCEPVEHGPRLRRHSLSYVMTEITHCINDLGVHDFEFANPPFTGDRPFAEALCHEILRRRLRIHWSVSPRVDQVDRALLQLMRRAGCHTVHFGLESGDEQVLDAIGKGLRLQQARQAVRAARRAGLRVVGHFVIGLPGETAVTAQRTIDYALKLGLSELRVRPAVPLPRTPLGELARDAGWITSAHWADLSMSGPAIMGNGELSTEMIDALRGVLLDRFYSRPWFVLRRLLGALGGRKPACQGFR